MPPFPLYDMRPSPRQKDGAFERESAARLLERLDDVRQEVRAALTAVLCLGPGAAFLEEGLKGKDTPAPLHLEKRARLAWEGLSPGSFDLILSLAPLGRENDPLLALQGIHALLRPGGLFLATFAGGDTLTELRQTLLEAEANLQGTATPRVARAPDLAAFGALMQEAGFEAPALDKDRLSLAFPDLHALAQTLRQAGATGALAERSRRFAPRRLFNEAEKIYRARFPSPDGQGIRVTLDLLFLLGWRRGA